MLSWLKKRFEGLGRAFAEVWFYVLFGACLGLGMVYAAKEGHWSHEFFKLIIEHLGIGLIVSSFAVLLFEWRSESQRVLHLAERLMEVSRAEGKEGLTRVLRTLIGSRDDLPTAAHDIEESCEKVVLAISELLNRRTRINDQYVGFIASLQRRLIRNNLDAFLNLSHGQTAEINVPRTAGELAEDVLKAQIRALEKGDQYDVVSDLRTWINGQLDGFQEETEDAIVKHGIKVRRLFNLAHASLDHMPPSQFNSIIERHRESMRAMIRQNPDSPGYEVRWVSGSMLGYHADLGSRLHFGLITLRDGEGLRFDFPEADLSRIIISPNRDQFERHRAIFEELWEKAKELADLPTFASLVGEQRPRE
jgi:hypothetical protein